MPGGRFKLFNKDQTSFDIPRPRKIALSAAWQAIYSKGGRPNPDSASMDGFTFTYQPQPATSRPWSLRPTTSYRVRAEEKPDGGTRIGVTRLGAPSRAFDTSTFPLLFLKSAVEAELKRAAPSRSLFLSYRRDDSADVVGRIRDRLCQRFGTDALFRDVDDISLGSDFHRAIDTALQEARVVLAIVGLHWAGRQSVRLQGPDDPVRVELETALARKLPILPVFVSGVTHINERVLPPSLMPLASINGWRVRPDPDFQSDIEKLQDAIAPKLRGA
jgi:TIR domain